VVPTSTREGFDVPCCGQSDQALWADPDSLLFVHRSSHDSPDWIPPLYLRRLTSRRMIESARYAFWWLALAPVWTAAFGVLGAVTHDVSMLAIGLTVTIWNVLVAAIYAPRAYRAAQSN
jgi:hypothetical protein